MPTYQNHAQGVALPATKLGVDSTTVMSKTTPQIKTDATREYGASVELYGQRFQTASRAHAPSLPEGVGRSSTPTTTPI